MVDHYGNKVFWAWNHKMLEKDIRRQIAGFAEQKISGFFIHSRCGLKTPYMSEEWFAAMQTAIDEAEKQGLEVWLYDEDGWPSGFAGGAVVAQNKEFCIRRLKLTDDFKKCEGANIVASFRMTTRGYIKEKPEKCDKIFYLQNDYHYVDLLNRKACRAFIESTYEKYKERFGKYFGTTIRGIFTDEPQMDGYVSYSPAMAEEYEKAYRRKFADDLVYLIGNDEREYKKFRLRYIKVLFRLFVSSYIGQINEWCKENGISMTGHLPGEDGLLYQGELAGSCDLAYRNMGYPGIDHLGRRLCSDVLLKTIGSVKNQEGLDRVISETFGCCGWNTSFAQFARIWAHQACAGINSACLHFSAYSIVGNRKRDYPAFFSEQEPWFSQWHYLNDWMASVNRFSSGEEIDKSILVIGALESATCEREEIARRISNEYRVLVESLCDLQAGFDTVDEFALSDCGSVAQGKLRVGRCEYEYVIVPYTESLLLSTVRLLLSFQRSGGKILFTSATPSLAEFEPSAELNELIEGQRNLPFGGVVQNRAELWKKALQYIGHSGEFTCRAKDSRVIKDLRKRVTRQNGETHILLTNKSASDQKTFTLCSQTYGAFREKIFAGGERDAECFGDDHCMTEVVLQPMQTRGFVFGNYPRTETPSLYKTLCVQPETCALNDENAITLDRCSYSVDGAPYSAEEYVLHVQNKVFEYSKTLSSPQTLRVRYAFVSRIEKEADVMIERSTVQKIYWNGERAEFTEKTFLDKDIRAISPCSLRRGENELVLEYTLYPSTVRYDPDRDFETERNRFSYELEIESVYVAGNFSAEGALQREFYGYSRAGGFVLTEQKPIDFSKDLTPQGLPFYCGRFQKTFTFGYDGGRVELGVDRMNAVCAEVFLNGKACGCLFSEHDRLDASGLAVRGTNAVTVTFYGGLRNLLGPHHHYSGETDFTGQSTFMGKRGFEDEVTDFSLRENTYTERYSFVPFGGGNLVVFSYRD